MNELKYVVFRPKGFNLLGDRAVVFNGLLQHSSIGLAITREGGKIISAGFCGIRNNKNGIYIEVYGESISLGLKSSVSDSNIILRTITRMHPLMGYIDENEDTNS